MGSEASAIDVSVSAPLVRVERGAMVYQPQPRRASKVLAVVVVYARRFPLGCELMSGRVLDEFSLGEPRRVKE